MIKITHTQLLNIMKSGDFIFDMSKPDVLAVKDRKGERLAIIMDTAEGDLMDYELYTNNTSVLKAI